MSPLAGSVLLCAVIPAGLMFVTLVGFSVAIDVATAPWRQDSTRARSPHPPGALPHSTDGSPR